MKRVVLVLSLVFVVMAGIALPAGAQAPNTNVGFGPTTGGGFRPSVPGFPFPPPPPLDPRVIWKDQWVCRAAGPAEVVGFRVQCAAATFLDFHIADCCIPGDHWQLKGKAWDTNPNTAVTTAPGPANLFGVPGRVYNYIAGGGGLDTYVECSYLHGVNVFLADSFLFFSSDGNCAVTPDPVVRRIDRTP
ncbi:MAG TPA: hypothetical protein VLV54_16680 [Thermoanaerobaculia bacterium]|nr:hypothetical protein [Thermoanaerobaculia bacterium]